MIAILLGAISALVLALMLARRLSPEFRSRGEQPKYRFLTDLGDSPGQNVIGSKRKEENRDAIS